MDKNSSIIPVTKSSMPDFQEYMKEIRDIWDSKWLTNMGIKHQQFENQLLDYLGVPNVTLFSSGHFALESVFEAFGLTGEVITTPFTFSSTTHAIVRKGLTPVFCDIRFDDYTIDSDKIETLITEKTCAIIPVHVYGNPCQIESINRLAEKYGLKVIYDGAHAFGVKYNGDGIGCFGDATMFSFHATKVFNTIEGGALAYSDSKLRHILDQIKNFGIEGPEAVEYPGGNGKMNELQAAMGICNLRYIDSEIAKRKTAVERYIAKLDGIEGIKLTIARKDEQLNYSYFPVMFDGYRKSRDEVFDELKANGIHARKYFYPLTSSYSCYKEKYSSEKMPVAKYISERIITLPLFSDLSLEDVDRICKIIKKVV